MSRWPSLAPIGPHSFPSYGSPTLATISTAEPLPNVLDSTCSWYNVFNAGQGPILDHGLQLLKRSTAVPDDADHPARRWFQRWSLWPPVLELPPWIRWVQASPAYPDHPIAGALIAAAAPLAPWIDLTPSFPKHVISGVHLVPIGREGQSALDGDPDDPQRRCFGTRSYGNLSDAIVAIGVLVRAGGVVVCEGLAYGLALACRRSEPVVVTFGAAGWSSEATAFALGRFANLMLAPAGSRSERATAGALGRRVQAYGGNRRVPHVRGASDVAVIAGPLPLADPRRFKAEVEIYENLALPRWEAHRLAYTTVACQARERL